jgi:hypothetical protein
MGEAIELRSMEEVSVAVPTVMGKRRARPATAVDMVDRTGVSSRAGAVVASGKAVSGCGRCVRLVRPAVLLIYLAQGH